MRPGLWEMDRVQEKEEILITVKNNIAFQGRKRGISGSKNQHHITIQHFLSPSDLLLLLFPPITKKTIFPSFPPPPRPTNLINIPNAFARSLHKSFPQIAAKRKVGKIKIPKQNQMLAERGLRT
jgi:hypothetical protein